MRLFRRFSNNMDFDTFLVVHQWTSALYERQNASFLMTKRWGRKWLLSFRKKGLRCRFSYSIKSSFPPDRPPSSFLAFATAAVTVVKGFNQKKGFWNWHAKMHSVQFLLAAAERKHWYWYSSTLSSMVRMKIPYLACVTGFMPSLICIEN